MMSLGLFELHQTCGTDLIRFNDEEKDVILTLANLNFEITKRLCGPPMVMADVPIKEHEEVARILCSINQKKYEELKDRYIHNIELSLLPEHPPESSMQNKSTVKSGHTKKAASRKKSSARKTPAGGKIITRLRSSRMESQNGFQVETEDETSLPDTAFGTKVPPSLTEDPYKKNYSPRQMSNQGNKAMSAEFPSRSTRLQSRRQLSIKSEPSGTPPLLTFDSIAIPALNITPTSLDTSAQVSSAIVMPSIESSPAKAMSGNTSVPDVTSPQVQTSNERGSTYPALISRAIEESANGRLMVAEIYATLPVYLPTIISKLDPSEPGKGGRRKTKEEVFQENVRQNLSRNKHLFRNIKHEKTGKSTGFWELVVKSEASPGPSMSSEASSSSSSKRKSTPRSSAGPSKRSKTDKK